MVCQYQLEYLVCLLSIVYCPLSIVPCKYQSMGCNPDLYQLFQEEAQEILEYIRETLLELTQPMVLPNFPKLSLALAIDLMRILQSDAADLDIIEVQIAAYRLEILLRLIQQKKVVEIDSKLKKEIMEASEALKRSLLPYLNTDRSATVYVAMETPSSLVHKDSQLDFNQITEIELSALDEFKNLESIENLNHVSSELTIQTANLLVWLVGSDIFTIPYNRIEASLMSNVEQIIQSAGKDFLQWQQQTIPIYRLSELLNGFALPELNSSSTKANVDSPKMRLMLIIKQYHQLIAIESAIERLVTQPELIIQPVDHPLSYYYGFSWWEDRRRVRVIDVTALLEPIW